MTLYGRNHFAIVSFNSHSAARKTVEGFNLWCRYKLEWLSQSGEVVSEVFHKKPEGRRERKTFIHKLFWRDPEDRVLALPVDKVWGHNFNCNEVEPAEAFNLIGDLLAEIDNDLVV